MKPAEHKISDASFTGHYLKLLVIRLKKFKTAKHVVLIGVVLICLLTRYVVMLYDKSQPKIQAVTEKYQKIRSRISKPMIIQDHLSWQKNDQTIRQIQFDLLKEDFRYFITNDTP